MDFLIFASGRRRLRTISGTVCLLSCLFVFTFRPEAAFYLFRAGIFNCHSFMFRIVILLFMGVGAGYLLRRWPLVRKADRGLRFVVWALLFVFGVSIGSNRELIADFGLFGWQAVVLACLGVVGSLAAVLVARRLVFRKGGEQ